MNLNATAILDELIRIRTDFRPYWEGENYFRSDEDGSFTACGAFSHFTHFFKERFSDFTPEELTALAELIQKCEKEEFYAESAYTCFLENIAGDPPDTVLSPYLSGQAQEYMNHWRPA